MLFEFFTQIELFYLQDNKGEERFSATHHTFRIIQVAQCVFKCVECVDGLKTYNFELTVYIA